jgi:hypothetical protein
MANQLTNLVKNVAKGLGFNLESPLKAQSVEASGSLYEPLPDNWYKSQPYAFKAQRDKGQIYTFYLPISPKNLNITTHFATNVITTLYGTVEEHSEQRYFDIVISGTTGFAPQFVSEVKSNKVGPPSSVSAKSLTQSGRKRYNDISISTALGGFFPKTSAKLEQVLNQAGSVAKAISGSNRHEVGVFNNTSGYIAFHNLYKFLLEHKRSASSGTALSKKDFKDSMSPGKGVNSPLQFVNYKDNNQYSCVVQRFVLERSADNPMLYNYTINLRAYDLRPIAKDQPPELRNRFKDLGLDSTMSIAAMAKVAINSGKGALSSGKGAVKTLGA